MNTNPRRSTARATSSNFTPTEIVLVLLVLALLIGAVIAGGRSSSPELGRTMQVTVHAGDTWWSLAEQYPVKGLTTSELADHLARANNVPADMLSAGSTVVVAAPAGSDTDLAMLSADRSAQTE